MAKKALKSILQHLEISFSTLVDTLSGWTEFYLPDGFPRYTNNLAGANYRAGQTGLNSRRVFRCG